MALEKVGVNPDEVTAEFSQAFARRSADLPPDQAARAASLDAVGAAGTRGQITGDVSEEASEQAMRAGVKGGQPAANVMRSFDETQNDAFAAARDGIRDNLAGGREIAGDAVEASEMAVAGVVRQAADAKSNAQTFYKASEDAGVRIRPEAFGDLMVQLENRLAQAEVIVDQGTPNAARIMNLFRSRAQPPAGKPVHGVSLELVDKARSRAATALRDASRRGDTAEVEALREIVDGVDGWLDGAVEKSMYDAGPDALQSLKSARKLWARYRQDFFGKNGADKFIARMVEGDASPRDVFAWLYSNGRMGANRQSTQFAQKLKGILGEGSDEWAALRQGAWAKLTTATGGSTKPGPQRVAEAITRFFSGETRSLARTLFNDDEMREMLTYARALRTTVPQAKATNASGSGYEVRRGANAILGRVSEMLGFSAGGIEGAIAAGAASRSVGTGGGWLAAKVATGGPKASLNTAPGAIIGGAAADRQKERMMAR